MGTEALEEEHQRPRHVPWLSWHTVFDRFTVKGQLAFVALGRELTLAAYLDTWYQQHLPA